ncbi:tRNA epoxyqueuosine(34) reductase QueG [Fluviispira multicolorata]|uniref:tRNA epoxyqueuosine(34) reductase QueG n=1 Tax=Fluviispira multicolorata TaxID=2654512 RepID=A0A833JFN6_9BACT|nr:tRNA epoxyqueuosine(34) reductase QueG [Fluviispira multicolorata]KAB8031064.1 tRNA epoxyqueuosine(34) reductase QueG [Fluviispira multicolorata]
MILREDIIELLKKYDAYATGVFSFEDKKYVNVFDKDFKAFEQWLNDKAHAGMKFLESNIDVRKDPSFILPNSKTALVFLFPYSMGHRVRNKRVVSFEIKAKKNSLIGNKLISRYVYGKDYHKILKNNLVLIGQALQKHLNKKFTFRPVIDSIPFFDRAHAREAHIGFIGKNTMLIRPGMGSFFFIATLLLDLSHSEIIEHFDTPKINPIASLDCGDCTKCLDSCPTNALIKPYYLDANKCLSYLTIEHRDIVPKEYISHFSKTIYGCDICQEVCPYNLVTSDFNILKGFAEYNSSFLSISIKDIALMTPLEYEKWFGGTAATRAKYQGLIRNALYHLYSNQDEDLHNILQKLENSEFKLISNTVKQIQNF